MFHGIFGFLGALCLAATAQGAGVTITLKEAATVASDTIALRDVADLSGADAAAMQQALRLELGPSPEFGAVRTLTRHQVAAMVQASLGPLPAEAFAGAAAVQVRMQGRAVEAGEIAALLKAHLLETGTWQESQIHIDSIGNLKGMELPPGDGLLRIASGGMMRGRRNLLAPVEVVQNGRTLRSFWVAAGVRITAEILTAAKKIVSGKVVAPDDVQTSAAEITDLRAAYARNPEDVVGKIARRTIAPGEYLTQESFAEPFLVKHGDTINLRLERNGVILTAPVRAEQDGRLGQMIRVRNFDFSSVLKAQVTGRAQVVLQ